MSLSGDKVGVSAGTTAIYSAGEHLELVCGKAKIVLTKNGGVYLKGLHIELQAAEGINGDGALIQWNTGASKPPPESS